MIRLTHGIFSTNFLVCLTRAPVAVVGDRHCFVFIVVTTYVPLRSATIRAKDQVFPIIGPPAVGLTLRYTYVHCVTVYVVECRFGPRRLALHDTHRFVVHVEAMGSIKHGCV
ncbi:hypothetical protein F4604DRAFT_352013 [Suillus subluteus]|nr:hypothetical protein F4604DRAFT_352013 [Suillus subluteus]